MKKIHVSIFTLIFFALFSEKTFCMQNFFIYCLKKKFHSLPQLGKFVSGLKHKNLLFFIGPNTSGKTSVGKILDEYPNFKHFSLGEYFREIINNETYAGKKIKKIVESGTPVCNRYTLTVLQKIIKKNNEEFSNLIIDGFPRTVSQVEELDRLLKKFPWRTITIIEFTVDTPFVLKYGKNRYYCKNPKCSKTFADVAGSPTKPKVSGLCDYCNSKLEKRNDEGSMLKRFVEYNKNKNVIRNLLTEKGFPIFTTKLECTEKNPLIKQFSDFKKIIEEENGNL